MSSIRDLAKALASNPTPTKGQTSGALPVTMMRCTVIFGDAGDGGITITLGASTVQIPGVAYLTPYTPTAGDVPWVVKIGSDLLVVGTQSI